MILYAYPPRGTIGALRNTKFVKYLPEHGWQPTVLTREWKNEPFPLKEPQGITVYRTNYYDKLNSFRKTLSAHEKKINKNSFNLKIK